MTPLCDDDARYRGALRGLRVGATRGRADEHERVRAAGSRPGPNGPARWALPFKMQRCDRCGYAAASIGSAPAGAGDTVPVGRLPRDPRAAEASVAGADVLSASRSWRRRRAGRRPPAGRSCRPRGHATTAMRPGRRAAPASVPRRCSPGRSSSASSRCRAASPRRSSPKLWRRAARTDNALAACDAAERELAEQASADEDDEGAPTATVIESVRSLALVGDSGADSCAEAVAGEG